MFEFVVPARGSHELCSPIRRADSDCDWSVSGVSSLRRLTQIDERVAHLLEIDGASWRVGDEFRGADYNESSTEEVSRVRFS